MNCIQCPFRNFPLLGCVVAMLGIGALAGEPGQVELRTDFPGGNLKVLANDGAEVRVEPDLRGDSPWFYWYFEARATRAGRVTFVFPEKVVGFKNGAIGFQGPAISRDGGASWNWMGTATVVSNRFHYDFARAGETVRLAVTIPYVGAHLKDFLAQRAGNPHLQTSVLTQSRKGRDVELLRIGEAGSGRQAVLVTARHHAVETIASYVLEGFLAAALSDSGAAKSFRAKHVLWAVPLVDRDGVEEGDQGKNRKPHDHNRDYGEKPIYPEVRAIQALQAAHQFRHALDFHCPTLVMDIHQVMYFVGAKQHPPNNLEKVTAFAANIKARLPPGAPHGPLVWLRDENDPSPKNSRYFAFQEGAIMSATLEIPFAPRQRRMDVASCREYGRAIFEAFVATPFEDFKPAFRDGR